MERSQRSLDRHPLLKAERLLPVALLIASDTPVIPLVTAFVEIILA